MAKPFDAATKQLIEMDPLAWLRYMALPGTRAELIDADLSAVTAAADRFVRVHDPDYLAHFELQSSCDEELDVRTLGYDVLGFRRFNLPVVSIIILLRKEAERQRLSDVISYTAPGQFAPTLVFNYHVVRVWELDPETFLSGPIALLPFGPLTKVTRKELPQIIQRIEDRLDKEAPKEIRLRLWAAASILMGLKYKEELIDHLLEGVVDMKESVIYQRILREGREEGLNEGRVEEVRRILLRQGTKRFGKPTKATQKTLEAILSLERLEDLADRILEVESWQELFN